MLKSKKEVIMKVFIILGFLMACFNGYAQLEEQSMDQMPQDQSSVQQPIDQDVVQQEPSVDQVNTESVQQEEVPAVTE